jgi:hypothetical protein
MIRNHIRLAWGNNNNAKETYSIVLWQRFKIGNEFFSSIYFVHIAVLKTFTTSKCDRRGSSMKKGQK